MNPNRSAHLGLALMKDYLIATSARGLLIGACACALLLLMSMRPALAIDPAEMPTPELQARYLALIHEFRCPVCQNETLADSNEDVAGEVRQQIRKMLLEGKSDAEIRSYLVSRYSEFILFKPEYSLRNAWLWLLPVALLALGIVIALRVIRARAALVGDDDDPTDEEGTRAHSR
jgi:cytochrome c-type biogenesis protein CcmH